MKRIFGLSMLILTLAFPLSATTLTGTIRKPDGTALTGKLRLTLSHPAHSISASAVVTPTPIDITVTSGSLAGTPTVYGNDDLLPSKTYYWAQYFSNAGTLLMANAFYVSGSTFDIGAAVPTTVTTNNISYGNMQFNELLLGTGAPLSLVKNLSIYGGSSDSSSVNYNTVSAGMKAVGNTVTGRLYQTLNSFLVSNNIDYNGSNMVSNRDDITKTGTLLELGQDGISLWTIRPGANPIGSDFTLQNMPWFRLGTDRSYFMNTRVGIGSTTQTLGQLGLKQFVNTAGGGLWVEAHGNDLALQLEHNDTYASVSTNYAVAGGYSPLVLNEFGGNVGIGFTTPSRPVDIWGDIQSRAKSSSDYGGIVGLSNTANHSLTAVSMGSTNGETIFGSSAADKSFVYAMNQPIFIGTHENHPVNIGTNNAVRMTISGTGSIITDGSFESGSTLSAGSGGSAGHIVCWKANGKELGYCSDAGSGTGTCTCN